MDSSQIEIQNTNTILINSIVAYRSNQSRSFLFDSRLSGGQNNNKNSGNGSLSPTRVDLTASQYDEMYLSPKPGHSKNKQSETLKKSEVIQQIISQEEEKVKIPDILSSQERESTLGMMENSIEDQRNQGGFAYMNLELSNEIFNSNEKNHEDPFTNAFIRQNSPQNNSLPLKIQEGVQQFQEISKTIDWQTHLIQGNYFIKHHKWSKPKLRLVWVDPSLKSLYWGETKQKVAQKMNQSQKDEEELKTKKGKENKQYRGRIEIEDILEVRQGKGILKNPISKFFIKDYQQRIHKTLAIVTKDQILELEAPTTEAKTVWMNYFNNLLFSSPSFQKRYSKSRALSN